MELTIKNKLARISNVTARTDKNGQTYVTGSAMYDMDEPEGLANPGSAKVVMPFIAFNNKKRDTALDILNGTEDKQSALMKIYGGEEVQEFVGQDGEIHSAKSLFIIAAYPYVDKNAEPAVKNSETEGDSKVYISAYAGFDAKASNS